MKQKKGKKISYDKESGVLSIEIKKEKSIDSDVLGNVVLDYGRKGDIVRVNLYDFSFDAFRDGKKLLQDFSRDSNILLEVK